LYFLLTGRPPFTSEDDSELLQKIRSTDPPALAGLRPDLSAELIGLVARMMDREPDRRPPTAYDVELALAPHCRAGTVAAQSAPQARIPVATPASGIAVPAAVPVAVPVQEPTDVDVDVWGVDPGAFSVAHAAATGTAPRKREMSDKDRARTRLL